MPNCMSKSIPDECHLIGHTWNPSCVGATCDIFTSCVKHSLKVYTIFYSVSFIIGRKGLPHFKRTFLKEILRSTLFLTCNGGFYPFYFCLLRKVFGKLYHHSVGFSPGFLASLCAIMLEKKSRRKALALYMLTQTYSIMYNILKHFGYSIDVEYSEVMIFSAAMGVLMYMYSSGSLPEGFVKNILQKCFQKQKSKDSEKNNNLDSVPENQILNETERDVVSLKDTFTMSGKVFFVSSSLHTLYSLLTSLPKIIKKPKEYLYRSLSRKDNFSFGAWLGSYVWLYQLLLKFLKKYYKDGGHFNSAVAGAIAGLSMLWQRNSTYALYIGTKVLELWYLSGIKSGVFPYFKHFDSLLYASCTALMFHVAMLNPSLLKPAYFQFLENLTGTKFVTVNRKPLEVFGYGHWDK